MTEYCRGSIKQEELNTLCCDVLNYCLKRKRSLGDKQYYENLLNLGLLIRDLRKCVTSDEKPFGKLEDIRGFVSPSTPYVRGSTIPYILEELGKHEADLLADWMVETYKNLEEDRRNLLSSRDFKKNPTDLMIAVIDGLVKTFAPPATQEYICNDECVLL